MHWRLSRSRSIDLDQPRVMAILNVTPDSFYDGGAHVDVHLALEAARRFAREGADVIDVGGESTRPGAVQVPEDEQISRVVPVIRAIRDDSHIPITIDTTRAGVAEAALDAGADAINDVSAGLDDDRMLPLAARRGAGVVLMHRRTAPSRDSYSDQYDTPPAYDDVVSDIRAFLEGRMAAALEAGVAQDAILLDVGLGFGKTVEQNLELIRRTGEIARLGRPVLSGLSRKSFVGRVGLAESAAADRLAATLGASVWHLMAGARIFRVHDVAAHVQALAVAWAIRAGEGALAERHTGA